MSFQFLSLVGSNISSMELGQNVTFKALREIRNSFRASSDTAHARSWPAIKKAIGTPIPPTSTPVRTCFHMI